METRYQPSTLTIVSQPIKSHICGACVIATLSNQKIEHVLNHIGESRTKFKTLFYTLLYYGVKTEDFDDFHVGVPKNDGEIYICLLVYPNKSSGHWIIYRDGLVYCSVYGEYPYDHKDREFGRIKWYWRVIERIKP